MQQRKRNPLVSSVMALRGLAAGITMLSLAGMTAYAGGHLHNAAAPLQPSAAAAVPAAAAPAAKHRDDDHERTSRLQLPATVQTTTSTRAVTTTHHS